MLSYTDHELGRLITRAHYQAWRTDAPPLDLTVDELAAILPNLIKSGSDGLIWPRVEPVRERYGALAFALEAAYNSIHEYNERAQVAIATVVARLNDAGIQPILVKGWSMSRQYPAPLLRPAGDIDLRVRRDEYERALAVLADPAHPPVGIDVDLLHPGNWDERPNDDDFWSNLADISAHHQLVHVLGNADQLRMLCLHYLEHGGTRALWGCDIALAFESIYASDFYRSVAPQDNVKSEWVFMSLAHVIEMLGARTEIEDKSRFSMPKWFPQEIERQWLSGKARPQKIADDIRRSGMIRTLVKRWPDPILATYRCGTPFNDGWQIPMQLWAYAMRLGNRELIFQVYGSEMPRKV